MDGTGEARGTGTDRQPADSVSRADLEAKIRIVASWNECRKGDWEGKTIDLSGIDLLSADLTGIDLSYTVLRGARLEAATLKQADLSGADLGPMHATTAGGEAKVTDLTDANLERAILVGADLENALLVGTNLSGADLRDCRNIRLDHTITRGAFLSPSAGDRWSVLRRSYTGARMIFNLIFLSAFFLPLALRAAILANASRAQTEMIDAGDAIITALKSATPIDSTAVRRLEAARTALLAMRAPDNDASVRAETAPAPAPGWTPTKAWTLLLGSEHGSLLLLTSIALLIYNLLRWILTSIVAPMRDEEAFSGTSPPFARVSDGSFGGWLRSWTSAYGWLIVPHRVVRGLFWVSIALLVYQAREWLGLTIWLPT
jgi:uncharacterized protein YjbI with pentapeptide repeats